MEVYDVTWTDVNNKETLGKAFRYQLVNLITDLLFDKNIKCFSVQNSEGRIIYSTTPEGDIMDDSDLVFN